MGDHMASFWQRAFNILVVILALYFFWLTANYRAMWTIQQRLDAEQSEAIVNLIRKTGV